MKKILLFITLISFTMTQSQIVNIPDSNFKNTLLSATSSNYIAKDLNNNFTSIDTNSDGEIQISEALNIKYLYLSNKNISNLIGISDFLNLTYLFCRNNQLSSLDVSNNDLTYLNCENNQLSNINISTNTALTQLYCSDNQLSNINISTNTALTYFYCDNNQLTSLDVSTNTALKLLYCNSNQLTSLNVSYNPNLYDLYCYDNQLVSLDVSQNDLEYLLCQNNQLISLDLSNQTSLNYIECNSNELNSLDVSQVTELVWLDCSNNPFNNLNLSQNITLSTLKINNIPNLTYINLNNGNNFQIDTTSDNSYSISEFTNLPNLQNVCVDDVNSNLVTFINTEVGHSITFSDDYDCNYLNNNQINGSVKLDLNNNGCDGSDLPIPNLMLFSNNGTDNFATFTQNNGDYLLYTNEGDFTTEAIINLPSYFTANPSSQINTFTGFNNTFTADFCIAPNQTVNDVNISLTPTSQARPGFDITYKIVYENIGTTQLSGNITLEFDETKLSFSNASETISSQTSNSLTFDYSNLNPFETRTIDLELNVSAPPTTEIDDILNFTTTINPIASDYTTDDNIFTLNQTVVGSYDPNDITCLEGNQILLADVNKYLHYVIRFQNTGTASAINVVVTNDLDANLDWSTLQLESLSHNNRVAIKNGNEIEFIFENIDLPDSTTDEPNSHGFIAYKIKPKTDIALDDVILSKADIFFDYNSPIETNIASTTIVNVLAVNENTLLDFSVYPTPTENILNIKSKTEISKIEIYSKLGQLILLNETENNIDISNLTQGLYFVKVEDINGNFGVKKIMKK